MNLIEELGIEKARAIVDGAPRGAEKWRDMDSVCHPNEILYYAKGPHFWVVWDVEKSCWVVSIIHDDSEYILDQLQDLRDLRTAIAARKTKMHSHLTSGVFQDDDRTDKVSDIRNHISPNTSVSEAHVNEAYKLNRLG